MRSLEMTASWNEEDEDVEVEDMEIRKHSNDGRDDLTESSSDEATGKKRRKHGGSASSGSASSGTTIRRRKTCISARERNLRRLESNERERMRMHSLNDAFEGDPLSPLLFNLALKIYPKIKPDITARGARIILAFADDVDAATQSTLDIKDIFLSFEEAALNIGLKINEDKTKHMVVSKQERRRIWQNITINDHNFEVVKEFKYLGATITNDNKLEREVETKIMAGNRSFFAMQHLMTLKLLSRGTKIQIYKTIIRPAVSYESET
ncbi:unnamed protein product [Diabrotica balteata]|uniref:Reverse transcriptase domain-containing protein n=1 Tax=Diabrotica balteata TaxID=107213 RepID=A0A9N9X9V6_DIABA|nr:unnamed protein product [Diabrotica balteata]